MFRFFILSICILYSVFAVAETVYKTTKSDGSVEFTDKQSTDSEEIKVRKPTTYTAPRLPSLSLPTKKLSPSSQYNLSISQPTEDSTVVGKSDVVVSVSVSPSLGSNHKIQYQLAGKSIISQNTTETFLNIDRGTHQLSVSIINAQGEALSSVASITFHMKRFFKKPTPPPPAKPPVKP